MEKMPPPVPTPDPELITPEAEEKYGGSEHISMIILSLSPQKKHLTIILLSAYGAFISKLYATPVLAPHKCFILRDRQLYSKLPQQEHVVERLKTSFRKFYDRYGDLIQQYDNPLSRMLNDILTIDQLQ